MSYDSGYPSFPPYIVLQGSDNPEHAYPAEWNETTGPFVILPVFGIEPITIRESQPRTKPGGLIQRKKRLRHGWIVRFKPINVKGDDSFDKPHYGKLIRLQNILDMKHLRIIKVVGLKRVNWLGDEDYWGEDAGQWSNIPVIPMEESKSANYERGTETIEITFYRIYQGFLL